MSAYRYGTPQTIATSTCCCTGTGTGTEGGCECDCCPNGHWSEYVFTIADLVPFFGAGPECTDYNGTWTLKYRGLRPFGTGTACVWSTDEVVDGILCEGDVVLHPFNLVPERWLLYCYLGFWRLINAGTSVDWTLDSTGTSIDFCIDGGQLLYTFADTSACCKWDGRLVFPTETNYLTVEPAGIFTAC